MKVKMIDFNSKKNYIKMSLLFRRLGNLVYNYVNIDDVGYTLDSIHFSAKNSGMTVLGGWLR